LPTTDRASVSDFASTLAGSRRQQSQCRRRLNVERLRRLKSERVSAV
jgi:hypothetical protein